LITLKQIKKEILNQLSNLLINGENISIFLQKLNVNIDSITKYSLEIKNKIDPSKRRNIYLPITSANRVFIPGSTIKGIIRSALLFHYFNENKEKINAIINNDKKSTYIGEDVLRVKRGRIDTDIMKYIIVRDSNFIEFEKLKVYEIIRIPKAISQYIIAIPNSTKDFSAKFHTEVLVKTYPNFEIPNYWRKFFNSDPEKNLWNSLKLYAQLLIDKEFRLLERLSDKNKKVFADLLKHLTEIKKRMENTQEDTIFLPIGFGKTYYFNSLGYFLPKEKIPLKTKNKSLNIFPSTRWVVQINDKFYPLGWCKIIKNV